MPDQNPLFVKVDQPMELKRTIIETTIGSVLLLKDFERRKLLEVQGAQIASRFIATVKDIERQVDALARLLPNVSGSRLSEPSSEPNIYDVAEITTNVSSSNLEDELRNIENKLRNISF